MLDTIASYIFMTVAVTFVMLIGIFTYYINTNPIDRTTMDFVVNLIMFMGTLAVGIGLGYNVRERR